jgi:hypothetical protein
MKSIYIPASTLTGSPLPCWLQTGVTQQWIAPAGVTSIKLLVVAGEVVKTSTHVRMKTAYQGA